MMKTWILSALFWGVGNTVFADESPLDVKMPAGFNLSIFAEGIDLPRNLILGKNGETYVGTRSDKVYLIRDKNNDGKADEKIIVARDLNAPSGVAIKDDDLYVAEIHRILKFSKISETANKSPKPEVFHSGLIKNSHHGVRVLAFGPDGLLYIGLGSPCNVCIPPEGYGTIAKISKDGKTRTVIARGVRNTVGFDWDPITKDFWFTDNGRDWLGDDSPPCELNHLKKQGEHFGFPYCHANSIADPEFGKAPQNCKNYSGPAQNLGPHVAPLGMIFYTGKMFPKDYQNQIFIAEHGSWNRSKPIGYRVRMVRLDSQRKAVAYEDFISGWLKGDDKVIARPVGFLQLPDGSLLITDDFGGRIFRLTYKAK